MKRFSKMNKINAGDLNSNFAGLSDGTEIVDGAILLRHTRINGWYDVTYQNSWVAYDSGTTYGGAQYMKDAFGFVHLRGLVKSGTVGQVIFTLPDGFRPAYRHLFGVQTNNVPNRLDVEPDGEVKLIAGNNTYVSLNGIKFQANG